MNLYQIHKYNPEFRDKNGVYTKDDWTHVSDTWVKKGNVYIPSKEYLKVEKEYIETLIDIAKTNGLTELIVDSFWIDPQYEYFDLKFREVMNRLHNIYDGKRLRFDEIPNLIKGSLRQGVVGCSFIEKDFHIYYGGDFYMEVGCKESLDLVAIHAKFPDVYVEEKNYSYYDPNDYDPDDYIGTTKDKIYCYNLRYNENTENSYSPKEWLSNDNNQKIPSKQYSELELEWLEIIGFLIDFNNIKYLQVDKLNVHPHYNYIDIDFYCASKEIYSISNDSTLSPREILIFLKLMMRGEMNCRLESYNFFIHMIDRFNIYIGCTNKIDLNNFKLVYPNITVTSDISPFLKKIIIISRMKRNGYISKISKIMLQLIWG